VKKKSFDCVEMKNEAQARLREKYKGLNDEEIDRRRRKWLETSDSPVARWWRSWMKWPVTSETRERPEP
jgi:hypothetical protein